MSKTYSDKLKDPRWHKKRNQVIDYYLSNGCGCMGCGTSHNLNVHHTKYIYGLEPWEYDDKYLVPLCSSCHDVYHKNKNKLMDSFRDHRLFFSYEFDHIIKIIDKLCEMETIDIKKHCDEILSTKINTF